MVRLIIILFCAFLCGCICSFCFCCSSFCNCFSCRCSSFSCCFLITTASAATPCFLGSRCFSIFTVYFVKVNQLYHGHIRSIAHTLLQLDDTGVTTWAVSHFISYYTKQFINGMLILQ